MHVKLNFVVPPLDSSYSDTRNGVLTMQLMGPLMRFTLFVNGPTSLKYCLRWTGWAWELLCVCVCVCVCGGRESSCECVVGVRVTSDSVVTYSTPFIAAKCVSRRKTKMKYRSKNIDINRISISHRSTSLTISHTVCIEPSFVGGLGRTCIRAVCPNTRGGHHRTADSLYTCASAANTISGEHRA